jgi:hypothetical protein
MLSDIVSYEDFCHYLSYEYGFSFVACDYLYEYYDSCDPDYLEYFCLGWVDSDWDEWDYQAFFEYHRGNMEVDDDREYDDDQIKTLVLDYLTSKYTDPIDLGDTVLFKKH